MLYPRICAAAASGSRLMPRAWCSSTSCCSPRRHPCTRRKRASRGGFASRPIPSRGRSRRRGLQAVPLPRNGFTLTMTSGTYRPTTAHHPRGGRPWCATCHTDKHLVSGSVVLLDAREQTVAVAVTCMRCGDSRVLETTKRLAAALAAGSEMHRGAREVNSGPVHCKETMSLVETGTADAGPTAPGVCSAGPAPVRVLRCSCGFQMDAPRGQ